MSPLSQSGEAAGCPGGGDSGFGGISHVEFSILINQTMRQSRSARTCPEIFVTVWLLKRLSSEIYAN
jgi:hypothetical protein